jgi:hypothetical protein
LLEQKVPKIQGEAIDPPLLPFHVKTSEVTKSWLLDIFAECQDLKPLLNALPLFNLLSFAEGLKRPSLSLL